MMTTGTLFQLICVEMYEVTRGVNQTDQSSDI